MKDKLEKTLAYVAARLAEPGTWQGIAFVLTLIGSRYGTLDWGQCAVLGGIASAVIKIFFPDALKNPNDVDSPVSQSSTTPPQGASNEVH